MRSKPSPEPPAATATHRTFLRPGTGKCLHYYFYFIDATYGLCHMRVPTWCPFRLQFCLNGHNRLARALDEAGIAYTLVDNVFTDIADFEKAQELADALDARELHRMLDYYAGLLCPVMDDSGASYHWSIMQAEYALDIVFNTRIQGTCIRHHMGPASIKLYDKLGLVLRIETTTNDLSFFQHHRKVEHHDGTSEYTRAVALTASGGPDSTH